MSYNSGVRFEASSRLTILLVVSLAALCFGCGERPRVERLEKARAIVASAQASVGADFAREELEAASQVLAEAEAEFKKQEGFSLKHSPDEAYRLADRAMELAKAAGESGDKAWREASSKARKALSKVETAVISLEATTARLVRCHKKKPIKGARALIVQVKSSRRTTELPTDTSTTASQMKHCLLASVSLKNWHV